MTSTECFGTNSIHGSASTHFCAKKYGGEEVHPIGEASSCEATSIEVHGPWNMGQQRFESMLPGGETNLFMHNVTTTQCQLIDSNAARQFAHFHYDHTTDQNNPIYRCSYSGTTKTACLDACTGTNGWKPPVKYSCTKPLKEDGTCAYTEKQNGTKL